MDKPLRVCINSLPKPSEIAAPSSSTAFDILKYELSVTKVVLVDGGVVCDLCSKSPIINVSCMDIQKCFHTCLGAREIDNLLWSTAWKLRILKVYQFWDVGSFVMYYIYGSVQAIPTYRVYWLYYIPLSQSGPDQARLMACTNNTIMYHLALPLCSHKDRVRVSTTTINKVHEQEIE